MADADDLEALGARYLANPEAAIEVGQLLIETYRRSGTPMSMK